MAAASTTTIPSACRRAIGEVDLVSAWLREHAAAPFAELVSYQPQLCERGRAPKQVDDA